MAYALDPEQHELQVLYDLIDIAGKDVVELGCGDGRLTWRYAERAASVLAIDTKPADIEAARSQTPLTSHANITFQVADLTAVEFPHNAFDVALFSRSL